MPPTHNDPTQPERMSSANIPDSDAGYAQVMNYPDEADYYALLGVSNDASDAEIRSAYRTLTLSFHPDKQPAHLRESGARHFELIQEAYETLIDRKKRTVYDLLGAEGVREEWRRGGSMGAGGEAERQLGVRAMSPGEFRRWFLDTMKARERKVVNSLVRSRVCPHCAACRLFVACLSDWIMLTDKGAISVGIDASSLISVDEEEGDVYVHMPSADVSSYALGYNFRTPLPIPTSLFGDAEEDETETEENAGKSDPEAKTPEMVISARVSGLLRELEREVEDPKTESTYLVFLR